MPIYEYECMQCGKIDEVIQKFSDRPPTKCKRCSGKLQKLISHSSFHLKGTGWYVTDYAGKSGSAPVSKQKAAETSSVDTKDSSNSSDKKSTSAPEKTS
ncbi:MAG: zinc ribbon domain-containing protein [Proteobacteria bacterium]|nr:zinc ribbon domain-containing protein [Pseudomonadota bacterium]